MSSAIRLFKRKPDVLDLFSYFRGPFFLHPVNGPYFLVDVISVAVFSVDLFSEHRKDMNGDEKCKNLGGLGVKGHPRSSETSPFDRAHMTSYSTLI